MRYPRVLPSLLLLGLLAAAGCDAGINTPNREETPPPQTIPERIGVRIFGTVRTIDDRPVAYAGIDVRAMTPDCLTPLDNVSPGFIESSTFKGSGYEITLTASRAISIQSCLKVSVQFMTGSGLGQVAVVEETHQARLTEEGLTGAGAVHLSFSLPAIPKPES